MRIGVDLGGTKIEVMALDDGGVILARERVATPKNDYAATVAAIGGLVLATEAKLKLRGSVGIAIPGTISAVTGLVKNANSTGLIGHPLDADLARALGRPVRVANDANCFALSEATDGAAAGKDVVFGIIAGTGVGGGVCVGGRVLNGAHGIAGEWGHNPLPWPRDGELPGPRCYCGRQGCIEAWCSGPSVEREYAATAGRQVSAADIAKDAAGGDPTARAAMAVFYDRFARAIATLVNILDPDAIVIGGGLSNIDALYEELSGRVEHYAFTTEAPPLIVKNVHGDSSGVRGAAWLWHRDEVPAGLPQ
ncbi:MAG TPA: ROK family protein [Rhizomicrobium sp.]|jgi:fructokinase|nr:ROK family protein [Rhizomicrobium sp.]